MRRFFALAVAVLAACVAHAAIILGPEHEVSPRVFGHAFGRERILATASDGTDYLVVWSSDYPAAPALNVTIVGADGAPRTIPSRTVRQKPINEAFAVWTSDAYFVAWVEQNPFAIYFARIARDGTLESAPAFLDEGAGLYGVAFNGRTLLVEYRIPTVVGASFALLDDRGRFLRHMQLPEQSIIAASAGRFVIASMEKGPLPDDPSRILATTIDDAGNIGAPVVIAQDIEPAQITMAADGSRVDLAIVTGPISTLLRYAIDATTLSVESFPPMPITLGDHVALVAGKQMLACWPNFRDGALLLESIPFAGGTRHETPIGSAFVNDLKIASDGSSLLAAWSENDGSSSPTARGVLLSADATAKQTDAMVTVSAPAQRPASMSAAGNMALVVWMEMTGFQRGDVVAARVDAHGLPLGDPFVIASNVAYAAPIAGFTGGSWLVAYAPASNANYAVRRVSLSGTLLDVAPQDLGFASPAFASNGKTSVFAGISVPSDFVAVRRFNADGNTIDATPIAIARRTLPASVAVGVSSDQFFVAWNEGFLGYPPPARGDVFGVRLDANGAPMDAAPIAIANSVYNEVNPCIASDGRDFMIGVITEGTHDPSVRVKKLLHQGALSGVTSPDFGKLAGNEVSQCRMIHTNGRYHLAFTKWTSNDRLPTGASSIDEDGNVIELSGVLATTVSDQAPVVVDVDGTLLTAYSHFPDDWAAPRVVVRTLSNELLPKSRGVRH